MARVRFRYDGDKLTNQDQTNQQKREHWPREPGLHTRGIRISAPKANDSLRAHYPNSGETGPFRGVYSISSLWLASTYSRPHQWHPKALIILCSLKRASALKHGRGSQRREWHVRQLSFRRVEQC